MDAKSKRQALQMFSNGLYIMTSCNGEQDGASAVSWVSQVSFEPPLIMVALRRGSHLLGCLTHSRVAAIHVLRRDQQETVKKFFRRPQTGPDTINGEPFVRGENSVPILQNVPAVVECRVHQILGDGGDHAMVLLEVLEARCHQEIRPLTVADTPWKYGG